MRVQPSSVLNLLLISQLSSVARARVFPSNAVAIVANASDADPFSPLFLNRLGRRGVMEGIHGLPYPWQGVFQTVTSFQPPLPIKAFSHFFAAAAQAAARDRVPGRITQRFTYGSLIFELAAVQRDGNGQLVVTKEFMQAAATWLMYEAQHGMTGFFEAWVQDRVTREIVYVHVATVWDAVWGQPPIDFSGLESP